MESPPTRHWDPVVRLTHWGVAAAIVANGIFTDDGSPLHQWVGYGVGGLLALRLLWGFVGPAEARFSAFPPSPRRALAHLREIAAGQRTHHRSHNPLGALMVYVIWGTLALVVATGIAMAGPPASPSTPASAPTSIVAPFDETAEEGEDEGHGEEADAAEGGGHEGGELMEEIHETAANLLFVFAGLHLLGVAFETRRGGRQIVSAMIGGGRRPRKAE